MQSSLYMRALFAILIVLLASLHAIAQTQLKLIPMPQEILVNEGRFSFTSETSICTQLSDSLLVNELRSSTKMYFGLDVKETFEPKSGGIELVKCKTYKEYVGLFNKSHHVDFSTKLESYKIEVNPNHIKAFAMTDEGLFYAVQTLKQLIEANSKDKTIPCLDIYDAPDFAVRAWQDDISRGPIPSLDYLSPGNVFVSKSLGEAVFLKLDPRGGELLASVCFGIPGLRALIPTVTIDGRVRKSITLLPDIKGTFKVRADIGSVQVGVSKICSDIEISQVADGSFEARLLRLGKLEVQAVDISGMKVSVDADVSGIWGFINKITSFFGLDIENRIAEAVRKESSSALKSQIELSSREIRSGQWLQRYLTEGYVQNLLNRATRQMNSNLAQAGFGAREVEAMVQGSCLSLASSAAGFSNQLKAQFFKICRSSVSVKLQHFLEDRNSRVSGCHDYYFAPAHQQWWSNRCFLKSDATVQIKLFSRVPSIDELQQCISSSWGSVTGLTQCGAQARSVIQELTAGSNFLDRSGSQLPDVSTIRAIWN
ncbi:hypothetical protein EBZ37_04860 [bacterium]|nr:hypothetical protein [bacterium]